jgi:hypothetical protein
MTYVGASSVARGGSVTRATYRRRPGATNRGAAGWTTRVAAGDLAATRFRLSPTPRP